MDSKSIMDLDFTEKMFNTFHTFLSVLEKSDSRNLVCYDQIHDIIQILQKFLERSNSSMMHVQRVQEISTPPKVGIENGTTSVSPGTKRNHSIDDERNTDSSDIYRRLDKIIRRDIEGTSDDSDCEIECSTPASSDGLNDLFKTDYPDEVFQSAKTMKEKISLRDDLGSCESLTDDPFIRRITIDESDVGSTSDTNDPINDPDISEVTKDVYRCVICPIKYTSKTNAISHIRGRQHRLAKQKKYGAELQRNESNIDSLIRNPRNEDTPILRRAFVCTLCATYISGAENATQHLQGRKHQRKRELHQRG